MVQLEICWYLKFAIGLGREQVDYWYPGQMLAINHLAPDPDLAVLPEGDPWRAFSG